MGYTSRHSFVFDKQPMLQLVFKKRIIVYELVRKIAEGILVHAFGIVIVEEMRGGVTGVVDIVINVHILVGKEDTWIVLGFGIYVSDSVVSRTRIPLLPLWLIFL